eukprot:7201122-Prymnesium_polylepis.2
MNKVHQAPCCRTWRLASVVHDKDKAASREPTWESPAVRYNRPISVRPAPNAYNACDRVV